MARITVTGEGFAEAAAALGALPAQIERASTRAVAAVTKFAAGQVRKELAAALGVPQRVLTARKRVASKPGTVWIGTVPIKAAYLGKPVRTKTGARAGRYRYDGAFVAKMPTGHVGIFRRVGKSRLPLREVTEPLSAAPSIVEATREKAASRLPVQFAQELEKEISRGRR